MSVNRASTLHRQLVDSFGLAVMEIADNETWRDVFSYRLRQCREKHDFTQIDLESRCGMGKSTLTHIESGKTLPSITRLLLLSRLLETGPDQLLGMPEAVCSDITPPELSRMGWKASLGPRLAAARTARGFTAQVGLARVVGVKPSVVTSIENGTRFPTLPNLIRLCIYLRVSMQWILNQRAFGRPIEPVR